jgi:hypothetical protein
MIKQTASLSYPPRLSLLLGAGLLLAAALAVAPVRAQAIDPAELEDLVAPVALYPDDVLGIILPAATFPLDIVRAARFLDDVEFDASLEPDPAWDDSIVALLNYPEVLRMMNDDLDWTWALGEAVLTDQAAVLDAAQQFRSRAYASGNLRSDDKQIVGYSDGAIQIKPANPQVVYIPVYEPREVIVYQSRPIYRYYPVAYPVYYYPYPVGFSFGIDYFWGVTSYYSLGWNTHYVHVLHHTHRTHPYYLSSYYLYTPYYPRSSVNVTVNVDNYSNVWTPSPRRGSRPRTVTVESRTSTARPSSLTTESQPNVSAARTRSVTTSPSQTTTATSRATSSSEAAASSLGSSNRRATPQRDSARPATSQPVQAPTATGTQTRSVRSNLAGVATPSTSTAAAARAPSTRSGSRPAISQPATRPQVATPAPQASRSTTRTSSTTHTSQGNSSLSRAAPQAQPSRSAAPIARAPSSGSSGSSGSAAIGGSRQSAPARAPASGRTRQP